VHERIETNQIELIILDVMLLDGSELLCRVADPSTRSVTDPNGGDVQLTGAEFDLLITFLDRPGRVLSRDQLLDLTRGRDGEVLDRSIDVLISRLRRKLSDGGASQIFKTIRNGGYQLAAKVSVPDKQR
jgi:two-component system phosphate regulon response regulator OmpR